MSFDSFIKIKVYKIVFRRGMCTRETIKYLYRRGGLLFFKKLSKFDPKV